MHTGTFWLRLAGSFATVLILAACGAASTGSSTTPAPETPLAGSPAPGGSTTLEATKWQLVDYGPTDAPVAALSSPQATVMFEAGGKIGGTSTCNSYGGSYRIDGHSLSVGQLNSTLMACADEAANRQEIAFLAALRSSTSFQQSGDDLTIEYDGGRLRFVRIS